MKRNTGVLFVGKEIKNKSWFRINFERKRKRKRKGEFVLRAGLVNACDCE